MIRNKVFKVILIIQIILLTLSIRLYSITIPEKDINLKINNLTLGCDVYLLLPKNLLKYNMERFISNNKDNVYDIEAQKADDIESYLNKEDYLGYVEFFKELGYPINYNEIVLRHYCFCLGSSDIIGDFKYNDNEYIQIKINLNDQNEFKLIMKDYLIDYDATDVKFLIDEYGTKTYIDLSGKSFTANESDSSKLECNVDFEFYTTEDFGEIQRAIDLAYIILIILFIIAVVVVFFALRKKRIAEKEEKQARRFWEKHPTKEEKKEEKKKLKEEKKLNKKKKK